MSVELVRLAPGTAPVSAVIPAYNAASWISEAIQSALDQTCPPLEVIVVDDGSTDDTWAVASRFPAPVRVLRKPNGGPASARNFGLASAAGEWIALLDADDRWAPAKLEKQLTLAVPGVALVSTGLENEDDAPALSDRPDMPILIGFEPLWQANCIANSSVLIRRDIVIALGGFDEDPQLKSVEDYHLWLRLAFSGARIVKCNEPLTFYRRGEGLSSNTTKFLAASLYNIDSLARLLDLPNDVVRERKLRIMDEFGLAFLHQRQFREAWSIQSKSFVTEPSLDRAVNLGATCLPRAVLDLRRGLRTRREMRGAAFVYEPPSAGAPVIPPEEPPYVLAIIDTEEEFDWSAAPPRRARVENISEQTPAQKIFERFGLVPTYAIDYPVASQPEGYEPLLGLLRDGVCEIGAHLHPWANPPVEEELTHRNSYPGNLPAQLERAKLIRLTETIEANLGCRPILYRAGKYGLGPHTFGTLADLGYRIDCSVLPYADLSSDGGPNYTQCVAEPSWVGPRQRLLELPVSTGVIGRLANGNLDFYRRAFSRGAVRMRLPGVLARMRLLDRIPLTPEGSSLSEAKRLTAALVARGQRVFVISYHSSSLRVGQTNYVRTAQDLVLFLAWIEGFLEFFFERCNGRAATPGSILDRAEALRGAAARHRAAPVLAEAVS
jgi:glycosyltransferase involved in cell wall biosynthesis